MVKQPRFQMRKHESVPIYYDTEQYIYEKSGVRDANFHDLIPMEHEQVCDLLNILDNSFRNNTHQMNLLIEHHRKFIKIAQHIGVYDDIMEEIKK